MEHTVAQRLVPADAIKLVVEAKPPLLVELEHTVAQRLVQADAIMLVVEAKPPLLVELEHTFAQRLVQADAIKLVVEAKPPLLVELEHTVAQRLVQADQAFDTNKFDTVGPEFSTEGRIFKPASVASENGTRLNGSGNNMLDTEALVCRRSGSLGVNIHADAVDHILDSLGMVANSSFEYEALLPLIEADNLKVTDVESRQQLKGLDNNDTYSYSIFQLQCLDSSTINKNIFGATRSGLQPPRDGPPRSHVDKEMRYRR